MKRYLLLLTLGLCVGAHASDDSARKVLDCMRSNVPSSLRVQDIELSNTDRSGDERSLKGRLFAVRETDASGASRIRAMLRVNAPDNLAGSAFLVRESATADPGMFVYLPSVRRVRRGLQRAAAGRWRVLVRTRRAPRL